MVDRVEDVGDSSRLVLRHGAAGFLEDFVRWVFDAGAESDGCGGGRALLLQTEEWLTVEEGVV